MTISDSPPPITVPEKDIVSRPGGSMPSAAVAAADTAAPASAPAGDPELEARRRKAKEEQAARQQAQKKAEADKQAAVKAQNCKLATNQLAALQSGQRMARPTATGEREFLDDAARAQEVARTREVMASNCN